MPGDTLQPLPCQQRFYVEVHPKADDCQGNASLLGVLPQFLEMGAQGRLLPHLGLNRISAGAGHAEGLLLVVSEGDYLVTGLLPELPPRRVGAELFEKELRYVLDGDGVVKVGNDSYWLGLLGRSPLGGSPCAGGASLAVVCPCTGHKPVLSYHT